MGLDPGMGCLHVDTPNRDSLACDLMEVCRAKVDAFVGFRANLFADRTSGKTEMGTADWFQLWQSNLRRLRTRGASSWLRPQNMLRKSFGTRFPGQHHRLPGN